MSGPLHPHPLDPPVVTDPDEHWRWLVDRYRATASMRRDGSGSAAESARPLMAAVRESMSSGELPAALDADVELARGLLSPSDLSYCQLSDGLAESALVGLWAGKEGVPFALRLLCRQSHLEMYGTSSMHWFEVYLRERADGQEVYAFIPEIWWAALRRQVLALGEDAYAAARAAAAAIREGAPILLRVNIAFAFPRERAWATAETANVLQRPQGPTWEGDLYRLLATGIEPALAEQLAAHAATAPPALPYTAVSAQYAFDLVDIHGPAAAPALSTLLSRDDLRAATRKTLAEALALADRAQANAALNSLPEASRKAVEKALEKPA